MRMLLPMSCTPPSVVVPARQRLRALGGCRVLRRLRNFPLRRLADVGENLHLSQGSCGCVVSMVLVVVSAVRACCVNRWWTMRGC